MTTVAAAALAAGVTANSRPIPILVYHQIADAPPKGSAFRSLYVSPAAFARQMALLKLLGFTGLSMSGLLPYLRGEKSGKVVGITFDDGYLNNLTHALPVLSRHGFSSTCYAVSGLLGQTNVWDEAIGVAQTPLMNAQQLAAWAAGGQEIGSHTRTHANLNEASEATAQEEIFRGKIELEPLANGAVDHFCYPFGYYTARDVALAHNAGFRTATTTRRSRCHAGLALLELPRVPVVRSTTLPVFWLKLATHYEDKHTP
ncbi:MAG: polysaccharide deacetylase family protein [Pseudomonadota bacterium]